MTPQSLGITPKQPTRPGLEDTAPPHPGHYYFRSPAVAVTHREGQTLPGTVGTLGGKHTPSHTNTNKPTQTHTRGLNPNPNLPTQRDKYTLATGGNPQSRQGPARLHHSQPNSPQVRL